MEFDASLYTGSAQVPISNSDAAIFVSPTGSDTNSGTKSSPLATLAAAVAKTRSASAPKAIQLRAGTYYMTDTVVLTPADSGLNISAYNGENATVSGGRSLKLEWNTTAHPTNGNTIFVADVSKFDLPQGIQALQFDGKRATLARYPNANPELDLFPAGYISAKTSWAKPQYHGVDCVDDMQCGVSKNITIDTSDAWHGMYQNYTVGVGGACDRYVDFRSPWCSGDFYLLRQFPEMHTRSPAGVDYEEHTGHSYAHPEGALVHAWRPGHWYTWMFEVESAASGTVVPDWRIYHNTNAISGLVPSPGSSTGDATYLGDFQTMDGCWAACNKTGITACPAFAWHSLTFGQVEWRKGCYARLGGGFKAPAQDGVESGWGPHSSGGSFKFSTKRGGNQGGEGSDKGGEWFVTNVIEELDADNEFFYDASAQKLYFMPNQTAVDSSSTYAGGLVAPSTEAVVPTLDQMIDIVGTQAKPVKDVTIGPGITFMANRPTFMEPRTNPSSGDWSLERQGAIRLEGTERVLIQGCLFTKLDCNAISINGYNRHATIDKNEFVWLGLGAIASWGREPKDLTKLNDGTGGEQPRYTVATNNFVHEIGHIQKQSSFYFQAITALATIQNNIVFNIPRAGINFNDGFGGGAEISDNLLFNTCRESGDHGAFNSWDRLPYITEIADGKTPSTVPAVNNVHRNFIVANYAADGGCLDNDDGSSYYDIHHNYCVYGGHKQNFDGHSKRGFANVYVYPQIYGAKCVDEETQGESTHTSGPHGLPPAGYAEAYTDNICILAEGAPYLSVGGDLDDVKDFQAGLKLRNNTIYQTGGAVKVVVGGKTVTFKEFQAKGFDKTTTTHADIPSIETINGWAKQLLGM
jgi:hypothetical protein